MGATTMKNVLDRIGRIFRKRKNAVPFKVLYGEFKRCLVLNNQILDLIGETNDKLSGDYVFDEHFIETTCRRLTDLVRELIVGINHLTGQKYPELFTSFHRIEEEIEAVLAGEVIPPVSDLVLPCAAVSRDLVDAVGGKNAHLGEIGSVLGLTVPEGFAVTTTAFSYFWAYNSLEERVGALVDAWQRGELSPEDASDTIRQEIMSAPLPSSLEDAILTAAREAASRGGEEHPCFAVRSSALGEDDVSSFAGQYRSMLNVSLADLPGAYREVVAGLYSREAMEYRQEKDFRPHEIMMAAACQLMVPATASGVVYSYDPVRPETETILISSSWGLGEPVVAGSVPTDSFVLDRRPPHRIREINIVRKELSMVRRSSRGTEMKPVREEQRTVASLNSLQLEELARIALQLEQYFRKPQDIEFALCPSGKIVILQSRPLALRLERTPRACDLNGLDGKYPILMRGKGVAAMEGVAGGPVWLLREGRDLSGFPMGAILVARYASPQLAAVIHRAAGFITDVGATTGHLATVAREFRVPALFNTENATEILEHGRDITLDTECLTIYGGKVPELLYYSLQEEPVEDMYEYRQLRRVLKKIEPLNLVDPGGEDFVPEACRTYHDLTRFVHEKAVETIIDLNFYHAHHRDTQAGQLLWNYPLDLILIDVGGGISGGHEQGIRPEQIRSVPMQALMKGMSYPGIWDMAPMPVDFSSFMASLTRTMPTRLSRPEDVGRNLAVISREYANINFRLGYHFTVIDAYVSGNILDNHIYFRFVGGVTDTVRRTRRTRLLGEILSHYDFLCEIHDDVITARLKRMDKTSMERRLFLLGLLVGFTRQLDVKMVNEEQIGIHFDKIKHIMEADQ